MPPDRINDFSRVAAYQQMRLVELKILYDALDLDLEHYLGLETRIEEESAALEQTEFDSFRSFFASRGVELPATTYKGGSTDTPVPGQNPPGKQYRRVEPGRVEDFRELAAKADEYLAAAGVDLDRDPLLQVLSSPEISSITNTYKKRYGDISWDESDYVIVMLAGVVATLLDVFLVRIPADTRFLGEMQTGSPLTAWLKEHSKPVHDHVLGRLEGMAKVPYDDSVGRLVDGLSPKVHRLMSLGHDPVLGFIFGVIDIMSGTGTFIDKNGDLKRIDKALSPESLIEAFLKIFLHLLSDVCTSTGIPPPFFTLLQLIKAKSPFVLGPSGEKVSWTDVARYMYTHGYDLRHFATMGVVPATIEMTIRGWCLCRSFESDVREHDPELTRVKMTSMLVLGHTIATSGNLLKTGVIFGMNPLALNWAQLLRRLPVTVSWVRESARRDRSIRESLDAQWLEIYSEATS